MVTADNSHFRILEDIARDFSGDVNFPTCMDAAVLVRDTLSDPNTNLQRVVQVIGIEPLISSKLLKLANSVAYNPSGQGVSELGSAIKRLGFEAVRTTSLAVAMDQMLKSKNLTVFGDISRNAWEHTLRVSAIARILAGRIGRINPEEAMLAGLVHDIGIFYLLFRAADYSEYRENHAATLELIRDWHAETSNKLLQILGLPEQITDAVRGHDQLRHLDTPASVRDVLYFANPLAGYDSDWNPDFADASEITARAANLERYPDLLGEAEEYVAELRAALAV
jgi:HD-like signal output (HDOD) protein